MEKRTILFTLICVFAFIGFSCKQEKKAEEPLPVEEVDTCTYLYGICTDSLDVEDYIIRSGENLSEIFARQGFSAAETDRICRTAEALGVIDPRRIRAGMTYTIFSTPDTIHKIEYIALAKSLTDYAILDFTADTVQAYPYKKNITLREKYAEGVIESSSLWNLLKAQGVDPLLAVAISDVYAWQIDFFAIQQGDAYKILYNEAFIDDTASLRIASVEGGVFRHYGKDYYAIPFMQDSILEFFDEEGNSLRKAFLKAPLDFYRITSKFTNSRFHPILKRFRAHHGVDYAAPAGTEVRTIGDGVVITKAYESGGGNYLKIKHNSVYTTSYMHLRGFAKGIQVGSHVRQGDVIGYVGSTGLSTGPHLDFRVYKNGQPINPLTMEAPPSHPVKPELMDSFMVVKDNFLLKLDSLSL